MAMFWVIFLSFATATLDISAEISMFCIVIRTSLITGSHDGIVSRMPAPIDGSIVVPNSLAIWAIIAQPIINDSIVIWRAWVLYPRKHWVLIVPAIFLLLTIGTSLSFFIETTGASGFVSTLEGRSITILCAISIACSLATNLSATVLIGYKLWSYQKFSRTIASSGPAGKSPSHRVLTLLAESGLIYCAFQTVYLVTNFTVYTKDSTRWTYLICRSFIGSVSQMYPALIVCLVHYRQTAADFYPNNDLQGSMTPT